ncbi:MAG: HPr family phosphocarrier protein [Pseudomonadota bacterium]
MSSQEVEQPSDAIRIVLTMVNRRGLHARAAAKFVRTAENFDSAILVEKDGQSVPGRSIMGLLMLAATLGTNITVTLSGRQAREAADALSALVNNGFGETD